MNEDLYVSIDSEGIENTPSGPIRWSLPPDSDPIEAGTDGPLVLRRPAALLDVLEEVIYRAESVTEAKADAEGQAVDADGKLSVQSARLIEKTPWNSESATKFALDCAEHALVDAPELSFPDGTELAKIIADARQMLDGVELDAEHRLGYFARLSALRRLRHDRAEVADLSLAKMLEDEAKDLDALDDPGYAAIIPVTDAVLAAIEALRHHVLPRFYEMLSDRVEEHEDGAGLEHASLSHVPAPAMTTPFGPIMFGVGSPVLRYEPAGIAARETARHARIAALDRHGKAGENAERTWQAARLAELLKS